MILVEYEKPSGLIRNLRFPPFPPGMVDELKALGLNLIEAEEAVDMENNYVVNNVITPRPTITTEKKVTLTRNQIKTLNVGTGAQIFINGSSYGVTSDATLELSSTELGTYYLSVIPQFPLMPLELEVTVGQ